jgi:2-C-methyl-D-erythritol 4-phosphate cytidylyltransferase/2-C-methyl-D-erythritol 2,4-cyclodiphosphate synthase
MGLGFNKQYAQIQGMPILGHTLLALAGCSDLSGIIVLAAAGEEDLVRAQIRFSGAIPVQVVRGGATRQESVFRGLRALERLIPADGLGESLVLIHDGARPLLSRELIGRLLAAAVEFKAAAPAIVPPDTIKEADGELVLRTLKREELRLVQTPQAFSLPLILKAHRLAKRQGFTGTDDCQLVERLGARVRLVAGDPQNIKITVPVDLTVARALKGGRQMRVGHGYDVHRLVEGRPLVLGGVQIPYSYGLLGHSDADVVLHALMDALLGAAKLGDLGEHFPDTDPAYEGISSLRLLAKVSQLLADRGYGVCNLDLTVAAELPRLAPYRDKMEENIASCLGLELAQVSVKATTQEGLGFVGRREGIAAWAVALLRRDD